ncbi:MAG: DUF1444 family protein [Roseiflexaceae bacterium]
MSHMDQNEPVSVMGPEQFANYVERRLTLNDEEIQLIDRGGRDGMQLRLLVRDQEISSDLSLYYAAYQQRPDLLDAVMQTLVRVLLGELPSETDHDYAALADRIYPMLKPIQLLVEVRERKLPMLVYREFLADLIIVYAIEEGNSFAFLNEDHLERWEIGQQQLHDRAITNLRQRSKDIRYTTVGEGEQRLFIFNSGDGFDATRLLLTETLDQWARMLPGNLVIGIPNRDFLIAFSDTNADTLRAIALQIQVDSAQQAHGLTDQLFTLAKGQVREYEWE